MKGPGCQQDNPAPSRFCLECGAKLDLARARKERGWEGWILRLLGEIHALAGAAGASLAAASAGRHYRQALEIAEALGMRPLAARCHLALGSLHRRAGDPERARAHVATATTMLGEMGMRFWLARAEPETGQIA